MLRDVYYNLLSSNQIRDFFSNFNELSYSKKILILENLLKEFSSDVINRALNSYECNYFRVHRVDLRIIDKVLKGLCRIEKEKITC